MPNYNGVSDYSTKHNEANQHFVLGADARERIKMTKHDGLDHSTTNHADHEKYAHVAMHEQMVQNSQA